MCEDLYPTNNLQTQRISWKISRWLHRAIKYIAACQDKNTEFWVKEEINKHHLCLGSIHYPSLFTTQIKALCSLHSVPTFTVTDCSQSKSAHEFFLPLSSAVSLSSPILTLSQTCYQDLAFFNGFLQFNQYCQLKSHVIQRRKFQIYE